MRTKTEQLGFFKSEPGDQPALVRASVPVSLSTLRPWANQFPKAVSTMDMPRSSRLASRLKTESADLARWWGLHDIKRGGVGQKTLSLPDGRQAKFEYVALQVLENPALKVAIYYSA